MPPLSFLKAPPVAWLWGKKSCLAFSQPFPLVFGRLRSLGAASNILVGGLVFGLTVVLSFQYIYVVFGLLVSVVALYCFTMDPVDKSLTPRKKGLSLKRSIGFFIHLRFWREPEGKYLSPLLSSCWLRILSSPYVPLPFCL